MQPGNVLHQPVSTKFAQERYRYHDYDGEFGEQPGTPAGEEIEGGLKRINNSSCCCTCKQCNRCCVCALKIFFVLLALISCGLSIFLFLNFWANPAVTAASLQSPGGVHGNAVLRKAGETGSIYASCSNEQFLFVGGWCNCATPPYKVDKTYATFDGVHYNGAWVCECATPNDKDSAHAICLNTIVNLNNNN